MRGNTACAALLFLSVLVFNGPVNTAPESKKTLAARLRHEENLIQTMACRFENIHSITSPQLKTMIIELQKTSAYAKTFTLSQLDFSKQDAEVRSFRKKWCRKGPKEREEVFHVAEDWRVTHPHLIVAFDGQIVRTVAVDEKTGKPLGAVETLASSKRDRVNRITPLTLLYRFVETPYSQIVEDSTKFDVEDFVLDGKPCTKYTLESRVLGKRTVALLFDESGRLLERQITYPRPTGDPLDLCERHAFYDYQSYPDASGETIWFPKRVAYIYYLGRLPNGTLVAHAAKNFTIEDIQFNVELPDSLFDLEIPKNAKVWDGINGMGWLEEGSPLPSLPPQKTSHWGIVITSVILVLVILVIGSLMLRRIRKRNIGPSDVAR